MTPPGVEQKSTWLQIRQQKPDYVLFWSAGVMTPAGIREAQASGYPREKIYAIWWAGSDHDVKDIGAGAKGYNAITIHNSAAKDKVTTTCASSSTTRARAPARRPASARSRTRAG